MNDEEIEIKLQRAADNGVSFNAEVLNYIKRLKAELSKSREDYWLKHNDACNQYETAEQRRKYIGQLMQQHKAELEQVRKETVKEIYQIIDSRRWGGIDNGSDIGGREHNDTIKSLCMLIKCKYGVEVDEQ